MPKNTGLGKGLDALFSSKEIIEDIKEKPKSGEIIEKIKTVNIEPNKNQPRRKFDEKSIDELAESIKVYGVIQPIIVTKKDKYYEIIAGERRWRASKKAGLKEIPCIVRNDDERKSKEIALIENIQREDLNPIEKAKGFKELIDEYGLKQQELADIMGMSRSTITNSLRILNLDPRVLELAIEKKITEGHCRTLLGYTDPEVQYKMALKIIETGQSVRGIEKTLKESKDKKPKVSRKYQAIYRDIEDRFQNFFGTKVKLDAGPKSGKIVIKYSSNEDLERILELINK